MISLQSIYYKLQPVWRFYNPVKLIVGRGCRQRLVDQLISQSLLIVTTPRGRSQLSNDKILNSLIRNNTISWIDNVSKNPDIRDLQTTIDILNNCHFDGIVAFGGGSSIDTAKVLNVALAPECHQYSLLSLLDKPELHKNSHSKPLYAVPTTSGTGSEVTPFATVWHHESKTKLSLAGPTVWPKAAFVDSELTSSVPTQTIISTGLDAINQAAESIWNKNANSVTLSYATRALQLGFAALPLLAKESGGDTARDQMAEASLLAGLAISHTRTALCHSMSYPITAHFGVPHGLACAFTMPAVLRHNLQAEDGRFAYVAQALTGSPDLKGLVDCFDQLHDELRVKERLKSSIPNLEALLALEDEMFTQGRADNNIIYVNEVNSLLRMAWGLPV